MVGYASGGSQLGKKRQQQRNDQNTPDPARFGDISTRSGKDLTRFCEILPDSAEI